MLIALAVVGHDHHHRARRWLASTDGPFATCPITEGSVVRHLIRGGWSSGDAQSVVAGLHADLRHEFWPDDLSYRDVPLRGVIGHRQVTDAYLVPLAREHGGKLATFDDGLAALDGDVVELIPAG